MRRPAWRAVGGATPFIATAVHAGHAVRDEIEERLALDTRSRRYEEDPFTDRWTRIAPTRVVALRSRFEVDLNRPLHESVYGEQAWDIPVWRTPPGPPQLARSYRIHRAFYRAMYRLLATARARFGGFVLYDLHSYNHRRGGPQAPPADPAGNPDINVGTRWVPARHRPLVDRVTTVLDGREVAGRRLDVRQDVRFRGGHLARFVEEHFGDDGVAVALDVKKFFMDEHDGTLDPPLFHGVERALRASFQASRELVPA